MDIKQDEISTLHDLYVDKTKLMKYAGDASIELAREDSTELHMKR